MNKKGISPVVATVALVLITVTAAVFLAGFVVPFVQKNLHEGTECMGYEDYFKFYEDFEYNCIAAVNDGTKNYTLTVISIEARTVPQEKLDNLKALKIQFLGPEGSAPPIEITNESLADPNGIRMLRYGDTKLSVPEKGGVKTYVYNSTSRYETVEVYPVLKDDRLCQRTDKIRIRGVFCDPGLPLRV